MKKLFLVGALALGSLFATAQEGLQGTWFVGGQLAFGNSKTYSGTVDTKVKNTTVLPIAGTFITPSVAVGAGIGYLGGETKVSGSKTSSTDLFIIKPLARKYWNITGGLFFFGQAAVPVMIGTSKNYTYAFGNKYEAKSDTTDVHLEVSPGFDYVINKWLTIETSFSIFSMGYSSSKPKGGKSSNSFDFDLNPFNSVSDREIGNLQVGVKFLF